MRLNILYKSDQFLCKKLIQKWLQIAQLGHTEHVSVCPFICLRFALIPNRNKLERVLSCGYLNLFFVCAETMEMTTRRQRQRQPHRRRRREGGRQHRQQRLT